MLLVAAGAVVAGGGPPPVCGPVRPGSLNYSKSLSRRGDPDPVAFPINLNRLDWLAIHLPAGGVHVIPKGQRQTAPAHFSWTVTFAV